MVLGLIRKITSYYSSLSSCCNHSSGKLAPTVLVLFLIVSTFDFAISQPGGKPIVSAKNEVDDKDLACAACLAIVDIVEKHMTKKSFDGVETRLYDALETICDQNNYRIYDFIPPNMADACKKFVDKIEDEDLVAAFQKFYSDSNSPRDVKLIERKICLNLSGACIGNKRLDGKDKQKKMGEETPAQDKQFDSSVDDLMAKHADKIKMPTPVKHAPDEL